MAKIIAGFAVGVALCMSWVITVYVDKGFIGIAIVVTIMVIIALVWGIIVYWNE